MLAPAIKQTMVAIEAPAVETKCKLMRNSVFHRNLRRALCGRCDTEGGAGTVASEATLKSRVAASFNDEDVPVVRARVFC